MDIGFFINYLDSVIQLPVNPEKVTVTYSGNNETKEVISLGEINILRGRRLAEISFESFFPENDWFPGVRTRGEFKKPQLYKRWIKLIMQSKLPCRLIITGLDISMRCSIEEFEYYHQGGDHEDAYYSIEFKECPEYHITEIPIDSTLGEESSNGSSGDTSDTPGASASPSEITIGCSVILNGTVHYDSYGAKPGKTFSNYKGKINFINTAGSHPYHVTTPSGGWLGWVTKESVVLA